MDWPNKLLNSFVKFLPSNNRLELIWKLAQVDFKKRYYNDRLGLFWALLNPILRVLVYYFAFTYLLSRGGTGTDNFALFLFSGLIFWMEFVQCLKRGLRVIQQKSYLIENTQINKMDLYYSLAISSFMGFSFNLLAYLLFSSFFAIQYNLSILILPLLVITLYLIAIGSGMIFAVAYIYFRDITHLIDIMTLLGLWTSGIFFDPKKIIEIYEPLYYLNPFLGLLYNVRAILLYSEDIDITILIWDLCYGLIVFYIGYVLINRFSHLAIERK